MKVGGVRGEGGGGKCSMLSRCRQLAVVMLHSLYMLKALFTCTCTYFGYNRLHSVMKFARVH